MLGKDQFSRKELCLLERTISYAHNSICKHRHAALVYKGGRVLSIANNKTHNDPRLFPDERFVYDAVGVHAEVAAIRRLKPEHVRGATIYIARVNNSGEPRMSRPCNNCDSYLKRHGIRKVIYTDNMETMSA